MEWIKENLLPVLFIFLIILAFIISFYNMHHRLNDNTLTYLQNDEGKYSCKFGITMSNYSHDTYEEAVEYCEAWQAAAKEREEFKNSKWEEIRK